MVDCTAAQASYQQREFLYHDAMPQNYDPGQYGNNYHPGPNVRETKFHRGFQRRPQHAIQQDAARLEMEQHREDKRDEQAFYQSEFGKEIQRTGAFNPITGVGRENEFRTLGKQILDPSKSLENLFPEHKVESKRRMQASKHRFFDPEIEERDQRTATIIKEGLVDTKKTSMAIGYGDGVPRTKLPSSGAADNFEHIRNRRRPPGYEAPINKNHSEIVFG